MVVGLLGPAHERPRKRLSQEWVRSTTQRRACQSGLRAFSSISAARADMRGVAVLAGELRHRRGVVAGVEAEVLGSRLGRAIGIDSSVWHPDVRTRWLAQPPASRPTGGHG